MESRNGKKRKRQEITNRRKPELGYYIIITDTEGTERVYFKGIRDSIEYKAKDKLIIKVCETTNLNMIKVAINYMSSYHNMLNHGSFSIKMKTKISTK